MADLQECANVSLAYQTTEQVNKGNHPNDTGNPANPMDHPIAEYRDQHDDTGEDEDTDGVTDAKQLAQRLAGKYRSGCGETEVHQTDQHDRDGRAINTKLHTAGDHLRQAKLWPLRGMQRHHPTAEQLPDQQTDQ
ncbi:hypothetical protein FQZ97_942010 [compost metagenome]